MIWLGFLILGFIGVSLRYIIAGSLNVNALPWGTLLVNLFGCLAMGYVSEAGFLKNHLSPWMNQAIVVGLLGAFTTFSTYAFEVLRLLQTGQLLLGFVYVLTSTSLGILAVWWGQKIGSWPA